MNWIWFSIPLTNNSQFKRIRRVGENNIGSSKMRNNFGAIKFLSISITLLTFALSIAVALSCSKDGKRARTIIGGAITIWGAI